MNYTSVVGLSIHQTVSLIMSAKPLNVIVRQPTTESMNKMTEQMAQMVTVGGDVDIVAGITKLEEQVAGNTKLE
jgi:hypothetical protein